LPRQQALPRHRARIYHRALLRQRFFVAFSTPKK
jgi:hypothetical protein